MRLANDGVTLPVANARALVHHAGAQLNAGAVLQRAPALLATGVAFAARLLAAQVAKQVAALGLVAVDVLVDRLGADVLGALQLQAPAGLLGREVQAQVSIDMAPLLGAEMARIAPLALAGAGLGLGLCGLVASGGAIALEFAGDGGGTAHELCCDAGKADALALERVNLVSFFLGQVCVGHGAALGLAGHKEFMLFALGPTGLLTLHFILESACLKSTFPTSYIDNLLLLV